MVVQVHGERVGAGLALEGDGDHLAALGVVAEAGGVGHADELIAHQRLGHLQRLGHHRAQPGRVGAIGDDEKFAVDEAVGAGRIGRAGQRHGEGSLADGIDVHGSPCAWCESSGPPWRQRRTPGCMRSGAGRPCRRPAVPAWTPAGSRGACPWRAFHPSQDRARAGWPRLGRRAAEHPAWPCWRASTTIDKVQGCRTRHGCRLTGTVVSGRASIRRADICTCTVAPPPRSRLRPS